MDDQKTMHDYDYGYVYVIEAEPVDDKHVFVKFNDGKEGTVDLTKILHGPLYDELVEKGQLMDFKLVERQETIVWSNGLDIAPEALWVAAAHIPRDF